MTGLTFFRSRLIKQYRFACYNLRQLMTLRAAHILVGSREGKPGLGIMVE